MKYSPVWLMTLAIYSGNNRLETIGTLAAVVLCVGFFAILGSGRQALLDMIARTAVVRRSGGLLGSEGKAVVDADMGLLASEEQN